MITIYQLPTAYDLPVSVSPFCAKLELYMRLTGREYRTVTGDIRKSPNKRVPYVSGLNGDTLVAESGEIIAALEVQGPSLDGQLSPDELALGKRLEALAEKELYFACLYSRFADPAGWAKQRAVVKGFLPWFIAPLVLPLIRKSQIKACAKGGFTLATGYARAIEALEQMTNAIGDKPYLFGTEPHVADCAIWANVMHNAYTFTPNPIREAVRRNKVAMNYIARVAERAEFSLPPVG